MMGTKTEYHRVVRHHLRSTEAVERPEMIRHKIDVEEDAVPRSLRRAGRINDPDRLTGIKIETGTGIGQGNILEEIGQDPGQGEDHVPETGDVAVVATEAETDTEAEKAADTIEHHLTSRILPKKVPRLLQCNQLFLRNQMLLKMMVASWKCSKRCKNRCNLHKNRRLPFWKRKLLFLHL